MREINLKKNNINSRIKQLKYETGIQFGTNLPKYAKYLHYVPKSN